jgi:hypothetical protein
LCDRDEWEEWGWGQLGCGGVGERPRCTAFAACALTRTRPTTDTVRGVLQGAAGLGGDCSGFFGSCDSTPAMKCVSCTAASCPASSICVYQHCVDAMINGGCLTCEDGYSVRSSDKQCMRSNGYSCGTFSRDSAVCISGKCEGSFNAYYCCKDTVGAACMSCNSPAGDCTACSTGVLSGGR